MWTHGKFMFFITNCIISKKELEVEQKQSVSSLLMNWIEEEMNPEYLFLLRTLILMQQWEGDISDEKISTRGLIPVWRDFVDVYFCLFG